MMFNWLSIITGLFYIVLGIVVITYKFFFIVLEASVAYALGAILVFYGIFRIVRGVLRLKKSKDE
ncbi:C4-dicarboxylate ABC transporter [Chryseobacterium echinoideorum]|uniref:C4-dicarboxylate ABC transporter n=1 Tax=Chryseobacterium echinoideorum TaxID=1549648 RepID=UPI001623C27F|nr:C4-dicarboxylate ABC transporter [Chryseobacterium echinoideorum]